MLDLINKVNVLSMYVAILIPFEIIVFYFIFSVSRRLDRVHRSCIRLFDLMNQMVERQLEENNDAKTP